MRRFGGVLVALLLVAGACTSSETHEAVPTATAQPVGVERTDTGARIDAGDFVVDVSFEPFSISFTDDRGSTFAQSTPFIVRNGASTAMYRGGAVTTNDEGAEVAVVFADGSTGRIDVTSSAADTVELSVAPDDAAGVTAWGTSVPLKPFESIYGLTERIVDSVVDSEIEPKEIGSLDRRGEAVTMYVTPTMSGYAPFYQSSSGYGLLVNGTMPGVYDIGVADPNAMRFEFEMDPATKSGSFDVFHGPGHPEILDAYTRATDRPLVPPDEVFLHWRGRDEYAVAPPVTWHGVTINPTVAEDLQAYDDNSIPVGIFHFDRPWAVGQEGYGDFTFDPERLPNASSMLAAMDEAGWKSQVWVSPWAIGTAGEEAMAHGYLAPNSPRALDLTNPDAVAWLEQRVSTFLAGSEGRYVDGFFMDRGDEPDVPSTEKDIYADDRNGRQVHNYYPLLFQHMMRDVIDQARPAVGFLIARPGYTGSQAHVMRWGGDTHSRNGVIIPERPDLLGESTDLGLRSVLISIQRAAFMGTPYWGSDIGGYSEWTDPEVYARWIQVGAASPLMRFHGQGAAPWDLPPGPERDQLLTIYKRYVLLHHSLQPYLMELAQEANENGNTLVRPLVFVWPDEAGAQNRWDEWMLGDDLLVAPVWKSGARERTIWFPPGRWVDFWDRDRVVEGPTEQTIEVPLDVLPLYVRDGSPLLAIEPPT
jgi:alpha-glucosidase (family GH31 glycosyl hydrolase)